MQASDLILGLLIILLVGWTIMIAVQQQAMVVDLLALEAKQVAEGFQVSPEKCGALPQYSLVKATKITEKEYLTTVGFDADLNQMYFCFYE